MFSIRSCQRATKAGVSRRMNPAHATSDLEGAECCVELLLERGAVGQCRVVDRAHWHAFGLRLGEPGRVRPVGETHAISAG